jgi:hypothetical protein
MSAAVDNEAMAAQSIHEHFQAVHGTRLPYAQFVGLSLYLHTLLRWGLVLPAEHRDAFVAQYPVWQHTDSIEPYYRWFQREEPVPTDPSPPVLGDEALTTIARARPYDALRIESGMEWLVATPDPPSRRGSSSAPDATQDTPATPVGSADPDAASPIGHGPEARRQSRTCFPETAVLPSGPPEPQHSEEPARRGSWTWAPWTWWA